VSFRGRLALFFLLIVVIPIAAIALLVVDVTRDSQAGKADARLSTGVDTALAVYEEDVAAAEAQMAEILTDPEVLAALRSGGTGAISAAAAAAAGSAGLERLSIVTPEGEVIRALGSGEELATATVRTTGRSGAYELRGSVTGPTEYVEEVNRLTGLATALAGDSGVVAGTNVADPAALPAAGDSGDAEVDGKTMRAASGELPESGSTRVVLFTEAEAGGFFDSRPRIVAALVVFLALALGFIALLFRTLHGQIGSMLDAAQRIGSGDFSGRVPVVGRDEMAGLASEFNEMSDRLEAQIEQLRRQRTELDRSVTRLGDAVASGLDLAAQLEIVAETALGGCAAEHAVIALSDGTVIERPEGFSGPARVAALAGQKRAAREGARVASRRGDGYGLAAPFERDGEVVGTLAVGRRGLEFLEHERDVFLYLLGRASESIENIFEHERVSEQAVTDELTGLPNNRSFRETIDREAARAERFKHQLSLIILDVDDFKQVNDRYGHLQGDEVLRTIGEILESEPRTIDEPARYGGEEFIVALPETGSDGAIELAERIRVRLEGEEIQSVDGGKPLRVTASFGTATMPAAAANVHDLFEAADEALYEAKRQGKNRVITAPVVGASRQ
jgi:diguanylate cyclase (GGDEF)-like protein